MARAEVYPAGGRRARNIETLRTYFRLLADRDVDEWIRLWAPDAAQRIPYATGTIPATVTGREEIFALYKEQAAGYSQLRYPDTELYAMHDENKVFARWHPRGELTTGGTYANENIGVFEFTDDGSILHLTEYFNPQRLGSSS